MTTEQDPHKHPLYRPHHGDMTGWRYLEQDEIIVPGDEYMSFTGVWFKTDNTEEDNATPSFETLTYRRRVTAESKPSDQPRFVTVVYEATTDNLAHIETLKAFGETVQVREGNALSLLDGIEERVVKVIREGV